MHGLRAHRRAAAPLPAASLPAAGGPAAGGASQEGHGSRRSWSLLVLLSVAQFMVILDATVVNVALPSIGRSLHFSPGGLQWAVTAYVLASGGLVLAGGRAADLAGRRRMFLSGLTVFTAASLASALSIITTTYAGAQRTTALATWGALGGAGAAAGVLAGGVLTTWLGWRSVFLVNAPIGVVAGLLSLRMVPRHSAPGPAWRQFDLAGAALGIGGLVSAAYAIAGVPSRGWASAQTLLVFALAAALLAAFAATERQAARPLLPPRLWRSRSLVAGVLVIF